MIVQANCLSPLPLASESVDMCVTSPPYYALRDYGVPGQIGLEATPEEYICKMVSVFAEVRRVLKDDGTLWVNIGDSYANGGRGEPGHSTLRGFSDACGEARAIGYHSAPVGYKSKDLLGIPWMLAFALRADGWYLRSDIIWAKPNPMPESVTDRPTKAHEYLFLLSKSARYYYDSEAIREPAATGWNNSEFTDERDLAIHPTTGVNRKPVPTGWDTAPGSHTKLNGRYPQKSETFKRTTKDHLIPGQAAIQHRDDREDTYANGSRNRRSVWTVATEPFSGAHFATFPTALVEPCILAGTSARGNCPVCGAAWVRVTESERISAEKPSVSNKNMSTAVFARGGNQANFGRAGDYQTTTTGWRSTCAHDAEPVPAIVLDPFAGSGTTGAVARLHGRRFVGLDLSMTYLRDLALARAEGKTAQHLMAALPLFAPAAGR